MYYMYVNVFSVFPSLFFVNLQEFERIYDKKNKLQAFQEILNITWLQDVQWPGCEMFSCTTVPNMWTEQSHNHMYWHLDVLILCLDVLYDLQNIQYSVSF